MHSGSFVLNIGIIRTAIDNPVGTAVEIGGRKAAAISMPAPIPMALLRPAQNGSPGSAGVAVKV
jgi:hypothetical protein